MNIHFPIRDFTCHYKLLDQFLGWLLSLGAGSKGVHRSVLMSSHLTWVPGTAVRGIHFACAIQEIIVGVF